MCLMRLGTPIPNRFTRTGGAARFCRALDDSLNEEWMADKGRFSMDGLRRRRLDKPWVRRDGKLVRRRGRRRSRLLRHGVRDVDGSRIGAVAGDLCDAESMLALKDLLQRAGIAESGLPAGRREARCVRAGIFICSIPAMVGIDEADALLIVGSNPRREVAGAECADPQAVDCGLVFRLAWWDRMRI